MRRGSWMMAVFGLIAMLAASAAGAVIAQETVGWAALGPLGPHPTLAIAVAPTWPADPVILAGRRDDLVRTVDGGATWERLALPAASLQELTFGPLVDRGRVTFAVIGRLDDPKSLYRSTDDGSSWEPVLDLPRSPRLTLSPDFARDGLALIVADGSVWRTRDAGRSWEALEQASGQRVQQAHFSPDFGQDGALFLAVTSGDFPSLLVDRPADQVSTEHEESVGILVSTDRGESWLQATEGLEIDGTPYRHVRALAVSPTFGRDGTVLAFAWGPRNPTTYNQARVRSGGSAIFRSRDRGASWALLERSSSSGRLELALSPRFADDGVVLRARSSGGISPASSTCAVSRSADGGESWSQVITPGSYEGCADLRMFGREEVVSAIVLKGYTRFRSLDGGVTWGASSPPTGYPTSARPPIEPSPSFERDQTLFVGSSVGGVWAAGPSPRATEGYLPCAAEAVGGFGRVRGAEPRARWQLGCALGSEAPVQIRERRVGVGRAFAIEDGDRSWYDVTDTPPDRWGRWTAVATSERSLPEGREQLVDGVVQRFEGGTMLFLPRADGQRTILVLAGLGSGMWRELPD